MKFSVVTILPELIEPALTAGVVGRAREAGVITVETITPREFTSDKHRTVDDTPYGGGPGMVMKAEPLLAAIDKVAGTPPAHRILLTPGGAPLTQARVKQLATLPHLVLVCGRYEGLDERVIELAIDEELSIGDYVLSGGELGALVIIDAVARYVPGVLGEAASTDEESHSAGALEYPHYTRPPKLVGTKWVTPPAGAPTAGTSTAGTSTAGTPTAGTSTAGTPPAGTSTGSSSADPRIPVTVELEVPAVLSSGNHAVIASWRRAQSLVRTAKRRPDLFARLTLSKADRKLLPPALAQRTHLALVHHPVFDRTGKIVTSSLTNFDVHDLARSTMTYGLAAYHIVTPVTAHREKAEHIATMWLEEQAADAARADAARADAARPDAARADAARPDAARADAVADAPRARTPSRSRAKPATRGSALALVRTADSVETVIAQLTEEYGTAPIVVATSAKAESFPAAARRSPSELLAEMSLESAPLLLLLGTGWGLADNLIPSVSRVLTPIEGGSDWNHLSVRSAGAILLDRLFDKGVGRPA